MIYNASFHFVLSNPIQGIQMALLVNEIFYSIQGESTWSGLPCAFVRLSGCNLRCSYCDTRYAYEQGEEWELDALLGQLKAFQCRRVTITGGEPLLQSETPVFVTRLLESGYLVSLETNGSMDIGAVEPRCIRVMDLKCPSSGMQSHNRMSNIEQLGPLDQVKFVIADKNDYNFAKSIVPELGRAMDADRILFSAVHGILDANQLAGWMLHDHIEARLQIQLHKYLWPDRDRGV